MVQGAIETTLVASERVEQALEVVLARPRADGGAQVGRAGQVADDDARLAQAVARGLWVGVLPRDERGVPARADGAAVVGEPPRELAGEHGAAGEDGGEAGV